MYLSKLSKRLISMTDKYAEFVKRMLKRKKKRSVERRRRLQRRE